MKLRWIFAAVFAGVTSAVVSVGFWWFVVTRAPDAISIVGLSAYIGLVVGAIAADYGYRRRMRRLELGPGLPLALARKGRSG